MSKGSSNKSKAGGKKSKKAGEETSEDLKRRLGEENFSRLAENVASFRAKFISRQVNRRAGRAAKKCNLLTQLLA